MPGRNAYSYYKLNENGVWGTKFPKKEDFRNQIGWVKGQWVAGITELQSAGKISGKYL